MKKIENLLLFRKSIEKLYYIAMQLNNKNMIRKYSEIITDIDCEIVQLGSSFSL